MGGKSDSKAEFHSFQKSMAKEELIDNLRDLVYAVLIATLKPSADGDRIGI